MSKMLILVIVFTIATLILPVLAVFGFITPAIYLVASLGVGMSMVIFFIVVYIFTRGILEPALSARLRGKAMWILITATRRFKLVAGDVSQRLFRTEDFGDYMIDPEASFMWPHGVTGAIATTSRASNIRPDMAKAATVAKAHNMETYDDLENYEKEVGKANPPREVVLVDGDETATGKPLRLNDVIGFFKHNLNPSYIQSVIKLSIARELEGRRQFPTNVVLVIGILLVCAGVAYTIIVGAQTGSTTATQLGQCQEQLGQCQTRVVGGTPPATTTTTIRSSLFPPMSIT